MGKALSGIPGVKQISMALGAAKAVQGLKEKLYAWANKIKTGFTPSTSMKMQMEQNYTAYLQNNSSYKSSKEYQDAFKNKSLRNDLEIIEAQANIALIFAGGEPSSVKLPKLSAKGRWLKSGTMSNYEARKWYLEQEKKIPLVINSKSSLKVQAQQAFSLRNKFRTEARLLMKDRDLANFLNSTEENLTWEKVVEKQVERGFAGDDIYREIIKGAQKSRGSVNKMLGVE